MKTLRYVIFFLIINSSNFFGTNEEKVRKQENTPSVPLSVQYAPFHVLCLGADIPESDRVVKLKESQNASGSQAARSLGLAKGSARQCAPCHIFEMEE